MSIYSSTSRHHCVFAAIMIAASSACDGQAPPEAEQVPQQQLARVGGDLNRDLQTEGRSQDKDEDIKPQAKPRSSGGSGPLGRLPKIIPTPGKGLTPQTPTPEHNTGVHPEATDGTARSPHTSPDSDASSRPTPGETEVPSQTVDPAAGTGGLVSEPGPTGEPGRTGEPGPSDEPESSGTSSEGIAAQGRAPGHSEGAGLRPDDDGAEDPLNALHDDSDDASPAEEGQAPTRGELKKNLKEMVMTALNKKRKDSPRSERLQAFFKVKVGEDGGRLLAFDGAPGEGDIPSAFFSSAPDGAPQAGREEQEDAAGVRWVRLTIRAKTDRQEDVSASFLVAKDDEYRRIFTPRETDPAPGESVEVGNLNCLTVLAKKSRAKAK